MSIAKPAKPARTTNATATPTSTWPDCFLRLIESSKSGSSGGRQVPKGSGLDDRPLHPRKRGRGDGTRGEKTRKTYDAIYYGKWGLSMGLGHNRSKLLRYTYWSTGQGPATRLRRGCRSIRREVCPGYLRSTLRP